MLIYLVTNFWLWIAYFFMMMILKFNKLIKICGSMLHNCMDKMGRYRIINDRQDKEPYLERYYLFLKDRGSFPFNIFLHKFLKSDPDDLHDHPWPYCTIILWGGYWEHIPSKVNLDGTIAATEGKWYGAGSIRFASSTQRHRIELDKSLIAKNKSTWTLFIPGPKKRDWGFWTENGWIPNEKYLENKKTN